jgi:hypothetical protein
MMKTMLWYRCLIMDCCTETVFLKGLGRMRARFQIEGTY